MPLKSKRRLDGRVRSYLDANCAYCHRPGAPQPVGLDLRASTPLEQTGLLDALPSRGDFGIEDGRLVVPGDPDRSLLLQWMDSRGEKQMPNLGSTVVDRRAVKTVTRWIRRMPADDAE